MSEPPKNSEKVQNAKNAKNADDGNRSKKSKNEKDDFVHFLKSSMALKSCTESFCKDVNELYRSDVLKVLKKYKPESMFAGNSEDMDQGVYKEVLDLAKSDVGTGYALCMNKHCKKQMKEGLDSIKALLKTNKMKRIQNKKEDGGADYSLKTTPALLEELDDLIASVDEMKKNLTPEMMASTLLLVKKMNKLMRKTKPSIK